MNTFSEPNLVSGYAERTAMIVPGLKDLHTMAGIMLAEKAPETARVLVLGAGGGLELKAFAEMQSHWTFDGIDPSAEMLSLALTTLGDLAERVHFQQCYIDSAPDGPYDAASCLLTLHFMTPSERRQTLSAVARRLKPGAPFVMAHHSFPNEHPEKDRWLARCAEFAIRSGIPSSQARGNSAAISDRLPVLSPEQDVALLIDAGFSAVELFYAGLTFKGWVAYKV